MEGTLFSAVLLVYAVGVAVAWLSPLYLRQAAERKALRRIALLWPFVLVAVLVVLCAALVRTLTPEQDSAA